MSRFGVMALITTAFFSLPSELNAAVISSQPLFDVMVLKEGNSPVHITSETEGTAYRTPLTGLSGTLRSIRLRYDVLQGPGWIDGMVLELRGCPTPATQSGQAECSYIHIQDLQKGYDGLLHHGADPDGYEIVFDARTARNVSTGATYSDGIPLDPTLDYSLQIIPVPNAYKTALFGAYIQGIFHAYYSLEDEVVTPRVDEEPDLGDGLTYGSLDSDASFLVTFPYASFQNLGNGSFAEGNAVTGVSLRMGITSGDMLMAVIREFDPQNGWSMVEHQTRMHYTRSGTEEYHLAFEQPFSPDPSHCYQLVTTVANPETDIRYYVHTSDVYQADASGCVWGYDTDDRANLVQNPALNSFQYTDYAFKIHTDGVVAPECISNCYSNVLFLPGFQASRLYRDRDDGTEDRLWEPNVSSDVRDLYLTPAGESARSGVYTKERDVLDEVPTGGNVYKSFISEMDSLVEEGSINEWEPIAYDWRYSLDDLLATGRSDNGKLYYGADGATSTPYIIQQLRHLSANSKSGKVTIVAHSNGGLLAKRLLQVLGPEASELVDTVILVAVPQVGTPAAIASSMHGYGQSIARGLVLDENTARTFASTSPAVHHLLPSENYFTYVDDPAVSFDSTVPDWANRYGETIHSWERLSTYLDDSYGRVDAESGSTDQPIDMNAGLLNDAHALHTQLDPWIPPEAVSVVEIAGWGVPTTVSGIRYGAAKGGGVEPEPTFTIDGDGTVVVPSALWIDGSHSTKYWVDLRKYSLLQPLITLGGTFPFRHADILEVRPVLDLIRHKINSSESFNLDQEILLDASPNNRTKRLRYSLHSPLSLSYVGSNGGFVGISTSTGEVIENIPDTYYQEFGEKKYIFTDSTQRGTIFMLGYATGTFTFIVEEMVGDEVVASTTWRNIPTTPQTTVTVRITGDLSQETELQIDKNGDGVFEVTIPAVMGGEAVMPKQPLTLIAHDETMVLGDVLPQFRYSLTGFNSGDSPENASSGKPQCGVISAAPGIGTHQIVCTVGTFVSDQYEIATSVPATLSVVYRWDGFLQPINDSIGSPNLPTSVFKAGSTVPVKFRLKNSDGGTVRGVEAPLWLPPQRGARMNAAIDESVYTAPGTTGNTFRWDESAQQYIYNWSTKGFSSGYWYRIFVKTDDGAIRSIQIGLK